MLNFSISNFLNLCQYMRLHIYCFVINASVLWQIIYFVIKVLDLIWKECHLNSLDFIFLGILFENNELCYGY